jgi:hypothetical protein
MEAILIAISEGIPVVGCLAWSFVDNYEVRYNDWEALQQLTGFSGRLALPLGLVCNMVSLSLVYGSYMSLCSPGC